MALYRFTFHPLAKHVGPIAGEDHKLTEYSSSISGKETNISIYSAIHQVYGGLIPILCKVNGKRLEKEEKNTSK